MRNNLRSEPYVGVSGVVSPEQQHQLYTQANDDLANLGRHLAIGVKATHKPQFDDTENKYGRQWYPVGPAIASALDPSIQTFNILQTYIEPDMIAADPLYPQDFFTKVNKRTHHYLDAVQIDLLRYEKNPEQYTHVVRAMGMMGVKKIVQCHGYAMEAGPTKAIDSINRLLGSHSADYVLFDASHGRGEQMNPDALLPFLEAAYSDKALLEKGVNFGVAGGLNSQNISPLLSRVLREFPGVSWDAEGQLHHSMKEGGDGSLDMHRAGDYLQASIELLIDHS